MIVYRLKFIITVNSAPANNSPLQLKLESHVPIIKRQDIMSVSFPYFLINVSYTIFDTIVNFNVGKLIFHVLKGKSNL